MNAMLTLFCNEPLAKTVSRDTLKHLAQVLITAILDERLAKLEDGPQIIRAVNVLVAKIIQKTDPTVCLG
jgi:cytoskeleton-associated protein 5